MIDATPFAPEAVADETCAFNAEVLAKLTALPDQWSVPAAVIRDRRARGLGPFPLPEKSPLARVEMVPGPSGDIPVRIIAAPGAVRGVYYHIHGGGWHFGTADMQDDRLGHMVEALDIAVVSVDYRLAPEYPWPAGVEDCEAVALWLVQHAAARFGSERLFIGGESAGAHLAAVTILRLRDRHGLSPFAAANLIAGCYDLSLTPSVRRWGKDKLILNTRDITQFVGGWLQGRIDPSSPEISPLYADLAGFPPALLTVGSKDPLLDDSLFMAARLTAAGRAAELAVFPGGCHVFMAFPLEIARQSIARTDAFLEKYL